MTTYYLNNSTGSDGNSGTSSGTPWQTMGYADAHIAPGEAELIQTATCRVPAPQAESLVPLCRQRAARF